MSNKPLARYYGILDGDERASYLKTKKVPVQFDLGADDGTLWKAHHSAVGLEPKTIEPSMSLLDLKVELGRRILSRCRLCERKCAVDRVSGERGHCGVLEPRVSSDFIHMGEEPELIPSYTIFFAGCTFNCVFCQNWDISTRPDAGVIIKPFALARMIQQKTAGGHHELGCSFARNVNWVGGDPTSNLPYILEVLRECSVNIPQVWNSNMYLTEEAMKLLSGVVDVYLTDFKYGNDKCALRLSNVKDYTNIIRRNHSIAREHAEMIIRHLVLPGHFECCTQPVLTWIADNLGGVKVNVMGQYRPEYKASEYEEISRPLRMEESQKAIETAERLGLDLCD